MKREFHKRNRLENYNYNNEGIYFLTLCTENRKQILSCVVARGAPSTKCEEVLLGCILDAPEIELSDFGKMIDDAITFLNDHWDTISILSYVIMPNHVHILVQVHGASVKPRATGAVIPKFVSSLKRFTNRKCGQELWQKSYYDHVIRDEADYITKAEYIENNQLKWTEDCYFEDSHGVP